MQDTPKSNRLHIAFFGRRNSGKSSLINALTGQQIAIVSEIPGTTTDPVYKAMEINPVGPTVIIDTAGIDDEGALGELRVARTRQVLAKTDLACLVVDPHAGLSDFDEELIQEIKAHKIPMIGILSKMDLEGDLKTVSDHGLTWVQTSAATKEGIDTLKRAIIQNAPSDWEGPGIVEGLLQKGDTALLVIPIDAAMPKGRLILPEVQTLRAVLDTGAIALVSKDTELPDALKKLAAPPTLVITDSQAFGTVKEILPADQALTSFSILFARHKGDLVAMARGARALETLKPGDKVMIAETCTHHPQADDIGRVKLPRWLQQRAGGDLQIDVVAGVDYPANLQEYKVILHCGGCMVNRREVLRRISAAEEAGVPIVNYGVAIAFLKGILDRALEPFSEALKAWHRG